MTTFEIRAADFPEQPLQMQLRAAERFNPELAKRAGENTTFVALNCHHVVVAKLVEYCERHLDVEPSPLDTPTEWDCAFCDCDQQTKFNLILAAHSLGIKPLLDLLCHDVARMIRGKTPEEIRKTFAIKNDFTPEEEERIHKENQWCEESL